MGVVEGSLGEEMRVAVFLELLRIGGTQSQAVVVRGEVERVERLHLRHRHIVGVRASVVVASVQVFVIRGMGLHQQAAGQLLPQHEVLLATGFDIQVLVVLGRAGHQVRVVLLLITSCQVNPPVIFLASGADDGVTHVDCIRLIRRTHVVIQCYPSRHRFAVVALADVLYAVDVPVGVAQAEGVRRTFPAFDEAHGCLHGLVVDGRIFLGRCVGHLDILHLHRVAALQQQVDRRAGEAVLHRCPHLVAVVVRGASRADAGHRHAEAIQLVIVLVSVRVAVAHARVFLDGGIYEVCAHSVAWVDGVGHAGFQLQIVEAGVHARVTLLGGQ